MAASTATTNGKVNDSTTNISLIELRQEINDKLSSLINACQDNKKKDQTISKQEQYIQSLQKELQRLQSLTVTNTNIMKPIANNDNPAGFANISTPSTPNQTYSIQNNYHILNVTNQFHVIPTKSNIQYNCNNIKYAQDNRSAISNLMIS